MTTPGEAAKLAKFLLGCFRRAEVDDPQVFATAVTRIFSSYPLEVGTFVCDPVTGLPGKLNWLPTVAEVKAACDRHVQELARRRRFENWGKRLAAPDRGSAAAIEAKKPTREELEKKYGKNFGLDGEPSKKKPTKCTMTPEELAEYYMKFRLGRQKKEDGSNE